MQHSAEEILASIPSLKHDAIAASEEIIQDAEILTLQTRDLLEDDVGNSWESEYHRAFPE